MNLTKKRFPAPQDLQWQLQQRKRLGGRRHARAGVDQRRRCHVYRGPTRAQLQFAAQ